MAALSVAALLAIVGIYFFIQSNRTPPPPCMVDFPASSQPAVLEAVKASAVIALTRSGLKG